MVPSLGPHTSNRANAIRGGFLLLGIALLAYLIFRLGVRDLLGMLTSLRWSVLLSLLLYGAHQGARALAFVACAPRSGSVPYADAVAIRLSGEAIQYLTFSGPILAEPTKAWLLRRRGLTTWEGLATTLAEYLASTVAGALMAVAGLWYVLAARDPAGVVRVVTWIVLGCSLALLGLFAIGIAARIHIIGAVVRVVATLPGLRARLAGKISGLPQAENLLIATLRNPLRLARVLGLELVGQVCLGLELFVLLAAMGWSLPVSVVMCMEGATKFITVGYFFVPGQVGVAEGTYAVIFSLFALSAATGVTVSFVRRIRSILTAAIGIAAMSILTGGSRGSRGGNVGSPLTRG